MRLALLAVLAPILAAGCGRDRAAPGSAAPLQIVESPAARSAGQPHLAPSARGPVLSWLEPAGDDGQTLKFARLGETAWTAATSVASGSDWFVNWADFPSVVEIAPDRLAAHWLRRNGTSPYAYDVRIALSGDGGSTWSAPTSPHDDGTPTEHGFVSLFGAADGLGVVWLDGRDTLSGRPDAAMTLRHATLSIDGEVVGGGVIDGRVCDCCQTDALASGGDVFVVYRDRSLSEIRDVAISRAGTAGWSPGRVVAPDNWRIDGCPVNGPAIDMNGSLLAVAWFTGADDAPRIRLARSGDRGATFAEATLQTEREPLGRVDVAVLDDGRVAVSWLERGTGQSEALLRLQAFGVHGEPGALQTIDTVPAGWLSGFPQMLLDGNRLVLAWTTGEQGATRIRTAVLRTDSL